MKDKTSREIIGVLLLNLGGPDSIQAVKPFLYNLFSDRQIIRLGPKFLQKPFAWLISTIRSKKTEGLYSLIGGKSPILNITLAQAKALEEILNQSLVENSKFKVFVGMRYWHPFIEEVIPEIYNSGVRKLIALSLYPQYSLATSGSSISKLKEVVSKYKIKVFSVQSWYTHSLYIEALVDVIKKGIDSFKHKNNVQLETQSSEPDIRVLFSAHSLPQRLIEEGDPYVEQIMGTINEITKRLDIQWDLSYQSKSGPVRWLSPSTDEKIKELAGKGVRNVLVVPISFVSDHIETLYEIDMLYRQMADGYGINLRRSEPLNTHPVFIEALKDITMKSMKETEWGK